MVSRKYFLFAILTFPSYVLAQETEKDISSDYQKKNDGGSSLSDKNTDQALPQTRRESVSPSNNEIRKSPTKISYIQTENILGTDRIIRISLETLLGLIGNASVFGSLYAALPWAWHDATKCEKEGGDDCTLFANIITFYFAIPAGVVTSLTTPLGVYLGGDLYKGNGSYGWTMLGHLAGMTVGLGSAYLLRDVEWFSGSNLRSVIPTLAIATVMQLTGAIVAYELSSDHYEKAALGESRASIRFVPVATLTNHGGLVGVGATF
jgi:hypothetical protein